MVKNVLADGALVNGSASMGHTEALEMDPLVEQGIGQLEDLLDKILDCGNTLRREPNRERWTIFDRLVWDFCATSQDVHMRLAGMRREPFRRTIGILTRFAECVEDVVKASGVADRTIPKGIGDRVAGVADRSRKRIKALRAKLNSIPAYTKAAKLVGAC